jgi:hypothetical protein
MLGSSSSAQSPRKILNDLLFPCAQNHRDLAASPKESSFDEHFEGLLASENVPPALRDKLRSIDPQIKRTFVRASSPRHSSSLGKHGRRRSMVSFLTPIKKRNIESITSDEDLLEPQDFVKALARQSSIMALLRALSRLKLLLRRERALWSTSFLQLGGAQVLEQTSKDLIGKEWRDDQDDQALQELLDCYLALCTIEQGRELLRSRDLPYMFVELLFSSKQPADYTTRTRIMKLMQRFVELTSTNPEQLCREALVMMQDGTQDEHTRPLDFLAKAHTHRPFKRWMTELDKPVRECFWIFLHDNRIPVLPVDTLRRMVKRRPIVPQGYVGGVEWVVMEYICGHLELINTILRALPLAERTQLRIDLRESRLEKIIGRHLRRASQTYYEHMHEELSIWASEAYADGWAVDAVIGSETERPK